MVGGMGAGPLGGGGGVMAALAARKGAPGPGSYEPRDVTRPSIGRGDLGGMDVQHSGGGVRTHGGAGGAPKGRVLGRDADKASSHFASQSKRFEHDAATKFTMMVPPPGAYDVSHKWSSAKGVAQIASGQKERFGEPGKHVSTSDLVGPGAYEVPAHHQINPGAPGRKRTLMLTTSERFGGGVGGAGGPVDGPGPGSYDYDMPYGNLLKQTYNVAIAEQSADIVW
jgi:hypothetical protein